EMPIAKRSRSGGRQSVPFPSLLSSWTTQSAETTLSPRMNPAEYANLQTIERDHWYYVGKRAVVARWLDRVAPPRRDQTLLDCGAGTGQFAWEMQQRCRALVLDDHEESLRILRTRFKSEQILS